MSKVGRPKSDKNIVKKTIALEDEEWEEFLKISPKGSPASAIRIVLKLFRRYDLQEDIDEIGDITNKKI